jgi:pimeloyl-ACP methyl ester carboxylesterase
MKTPFIAVLLLLLHWKQATGQIADSVNVYATTRGQIYQTVTKDAAYKFDHGNYSIFIPEGVKYIRGILIHQHGCGMEGTGAAAAHDLQYQAFAKKWNLAVIGPDLYPVKGSSCRDWISPEDGSGASLLVAIQNFASMSSHPELNNAPWLLWGHSGGGHWVLKMLAAYPARILSAFCYSAAFDPAITFPPTTGKIPVMLRHAGPGDLIDCWPTATHVFLKFRALNSFASLVNNPSQTHNLAYTRYIAIPFFESVLAQRLPKKRSASLKDMDPRKAWVGDTLTYEVYKLADYKKSIDGMSLLPDAVTAAKWKEYGITGTVIDHTPPPAPAALQILTDTSRYLTWNVRGDVESPIQYFNVYKNKQLIGRFPENGYYQTFDTNGDNAIPVIPPKTRFDLKVATKKSDTFSVTSVNQFNLESAQVAIIVPY